MANVRAPDADASLETGMPTGSAMVADGAFPCHNLLHNLAKRHSLGITR